MREQRVVQRDPEWTRLNDLFAKAADLDARQQRELLDGIPDRELRLQLGEMLSAARGAMSDGFLDHGAFQAGARLLAGSGNDDRAAGSTIGRFRVIREIGRGGMGAVYLAEREDFGQKVALKVIKRGMDTDEIISRFTREREVLASLNHPNIAHFLDGGTTDDGRPYFAMEYVEGMPMTAYCDTNRLSIDERLGLFRKVCSAVSYAHTKLIVHRDIKPSNILIGADGEPKLLDFGISKLLSAEPGNSETSPDLRLMTPEYASPEQLLGQQITTASDIYSLGVLLYELLSGHRPFKLRDRSSAEIFRILSVQEPSAPSTAASTTGGTDTNENISPETVADSRNERPERLRRRLKGDLDNIVLMSLRKEPERRYFSVEQFSDDVRRHLEHLPVIARPANYAYSIAKFYERNRVAATFAGIALIAIIGGFSFSMWESMEKERERARAEKRFEDVRSLANRLLGDWETGLAEDSVSGAARARLADISAEYLANLAAEAGDDPTLLRELAEAHIRLAHQYTWWKLDMVKARESIDHAESIARRLVEIAPNDIEAKRLLLKALEESDGVTNDQGPEKQLKRRFEIASILEELAAREIPDQDALRRLGIAYAICGKVLRSVGRHDDAVAYYRRAVDHYARRVELLTAEGSEPDPLRLSSSYALLAGDQSRELGDWRSGVENMRRALIEGEKAVAARPNSREAVINAAGAAFELGALLKGAGKPAESLEVFARAIEISGSQTEGPKAYFVRKQCDSHLEIADALIDLGRKEEARRHIASALEIRDRFHRIDPNKETVTSRSGVALIQHLAGKLLSRLGRYDEAKAVFDRSDQLISNIAPFGSDSGEILRQSAKHYMLMGDLYGGIGFCSGSQADSRFIFTDDIYCNELPYRFTEDMTRRGRAREYYMRAVEIYSQLERQGSAFVTETEQHAVANEKLHLLQSQPKL